MLYMLRTNKTVWMIFEIIIEKNIELKVHYHLGDTVPWESYLYKNASYPPKIWEFVQNEFGPHSVDFMTLDYNVTLHKDEKPLLRFIPYPLAQPYGVNAFA